MQEKRKDPRFRSDQKLWCEGQELNGPAVARDISRSGMAITSSQASEIGTQVKISFDTPDQGKVSMNMEVVWRGEKSEGGQVAMGLRVVNFEKGQNAFDRFINRHLAAEGGGEPGARADGGKPAAATAAEDRQSKKPKE